MRSTLLRLMDEVRLLNHRLVRTAEELHADTGVSVPGRAVLEFLRRTGPTSVPDIARARYVTRQHIQGIVDSLTDAGLVERATNPAHRRSQLIALTESGAATIDSMHQRERRLLDQRMTGIDDHDVVAATAVLVAVRAALDEESVR